MIKNKKTIIIIILIIVIGFFLYSKYFNKNTGTCGIESCHGLDISCGKNVPEICDLMYMTGDNCRQFVSCEIINNNCILKKDTKFDICKDCVSNCSEKYEDDAIAFFDCENKCIQ